MPLHVNKTILTIMLVLLFPMPGQARLSFCRIIWIRWILFASPRVFYWMIRIFYWPVWSFNSVSLLFLIWEFFVVFFYFLITYSQFCWQFYLSIKLLPIVFKHVLLTHEVMDNSECVVLGTLLWVSSSLYILWCIFIQVVFNEIQCKKSTKIGIFLFGNYF